MMEFFTFHFLGVAILIVNAFAAPLSEEMQAQEERNNMQGLEERNQMQGLEERNKMQALEERRGGNLMQNGQGEVERRQGNREQAACPPGFVRIDGVFAKCFALY